MKELLLRGWSRDALARRADGVICDPMDPAAVQWDVYGAAIRATGCDGTAVELVVMLDAQTPGGGSFSHWADTRAGSVQDLVTLIHRAAVRANAVRRNRLT